MLVTLVYEMPVNEVSSQLKPMPGIAAAAMPICNQIYPQHFPDGTPVAKILDVLAADPSLASPLREVTSHAVLSRDRRALNEQHYELLPDQGGGLTSCR